MTEASPAEPTLPGSTAPVHRSRWTNLPLVAVWAAALLPFVLWAINQSDPELAVRIAVTGKLWGLRIALWGTLLALVAALFYPPFPATVRRFVARQRTAWSVDRAPLLRALSELKHFETAQRHYEVGRLAWLRGEVDLAGPHLQRAIELEPDMAPAQHLFGLLLLRVGALPQAHIAFHNAEAIDPGHAFGDALLHRARVEHLLGNDEQAVISFEQHQRQHGGSHRSHYWHGEALLAAGRREDALAAFRVAAAAPKIRLTAEENWFRQQARVRCWRLGGRA